MASARFLEILRCNGVDQNATPTPGMVVPLKGENQVVLETGGMALVFQNRRSTSMNTRARSSPPVSSEGCRPR